LSASVFAFPLKNSGPQPWTNEELAELYRVVEILGRAGLAVETDTGMSDEGDPWFVFCRRDSGEVIAHFARIGGHFVAASIAVDETFRGANFRQIVERMVQSQPLIVPPPGSGTRLLTHPVVVLTAFVAAALAHSEKLLATDSMRAVDALWEHHKPADDHGAAKHGKPGWLDSLTALLRLPSTDKQHAHDGSNKETQALTLASLIAIAMTALQPVVDKVSAISHMVADELAGQTHAASGGDAGHSAQASLDLPVVDGGHDNDGASVTVSVSGDDTPQSHKIAAADLSADAQKVVIDQAAHNSAAPVTKVATADDAMHSTPAVETQPDANSAYLSLQQKVAVAAIVSPSPEATVHTDSSSAASPMPVITIDDVTSEALQVLHITKPNTTDSGSPVVSGGPGPEVVPPPAAAPSQVATNQIIDVDTTSGGSVINAISQFVTSNSHSITQQISATATLEQDLAQFFGTGSSLKVIAFDDTTGTVPEVLSFAPGVVLVDEKLLSTAQLSNQGGNLILDVSGGTVTLVGVTTIGHTAV
jgi:hypothetical protein